MSAPPMSWSKIASQGMPANTGTLPQQQIRHHTNAPPSTSGATQEEPAALRRRSPSPSHMPQTAAEEEQLYVLTLLTDKSLHNRMTALRQKYFPRRINKLAAHLTLFHALPESKLESSIIPIIQSVASKTAPFKVQADEPFRMKKGFAISVSNQVGGSQARKIHQQLQQPWKDEGFLSSQDAGGCRIHYTLMNKVDNEVEVSKAFDELTAGWRSDEGLAEGLALWKYDRGFWRWHRKFDFRGGSR